MNIVRVTSLLWISISLPSLVFGTEGYIGENPGFDFYSKIDEGNYSIQTKTIKRRLEETPTLEKFGRDCIASDSLLAGIQTTPEILEQISYGDYSDFMERVSANHAATPGSPLSTDVLAKLTGCLSEKYARLKSRSSRETSARETISYLGLYMDADTKNSDYDILTDIEKINQVIFSEEIKYRGTVNQAGKGFADFVAKKLTPSLYVNTRAGGAPLSLLDDRGTGSTVDTSVDNSDTTLSSLLGTTCTVSGSGGQSGPVDMIADEAFLGELSSVLSNGNTLANTAGYTRSPDGSGTSMNSASTATSGSDFFHTLPCTSIFCINVNMRGGSQNLLGGGKNVSIEGIIDKHADILYPISESSLPYQKMTNNSSSFPIKNLKFVNTIAGLRVYLSESPQMTRRDKREVTKASEEEQLKAIEACGNASAGLPVDEAQSRSLAGAGYLTTADRTTTDISKTKTGLGPQEVDRAIAYNNCMQFEMEGSRKDYYSSFSTDLTEIQAYTASMLTLIERIISTLAAMDTKVIH